MEPVMPVAGTPNANFNRFAIPVRMGLMIAVVKVVLSTIQYQFMMGTWMGSTVATFLFFMVGAVLLGLTGSMQKKAMGGYIDIKEAFQAIFVAALIVVVINFVYDYTYQNYIDPEMQLRVKEMSMDMAEKWGAPQETLDKMEQDFDKETAKNKDVGRQLMGLGFYIIWYGITSLICAAIVKKNKPAYMS